MIDLQNASNLTCNLSSFSVRKTRNNCDTKILIFFHNQVFFELI